MICCGRLAKSYNNTISQDKLTAVATNLHGLSVASGGICDLNLKSDAFMRTNQSRPGEVVKMIQPSLAKPLQHKFRPSVRNSSIINPVLPKGCVANCIWPGLIWSVALMWEGGPNLGVWKAGRMWLPFRVPPRYRKWFTEFIVHHHA